VIIQKRLKALRKKNMKRFTIAGFSFSAVLLSMTFSLPSFAQAELEVTWENPKKYTDIRTSNMSRAKYREQVFEDLEAHITELVEDLPEEQKLVIKVSNLDLAGEVFPSSFIGLGLNGNEIRVIEDMYIPRIEFSYQLLDGTGKVLQENDVKLKDMGFLDRPNRMFSNERLRYEKNMLSEWFGDEFPSIIARK